MDGFLKELIGAIAARDPGDLPLVLLAMAATAALIWRLKGRLWAYMYVVVIPFLNWSFGKSQYIQLDLSSAYVSLTGHAPNPAILFNPLTIVTGLVFVVRDFVQREMGHRVLILMALAIAWSFYYSSPLIALASASAFAISEAADWAIYTFTKYRLSTRILLSSIVACPIDTTVFLYGADLSQQMHGAAPGSMLNPANWIFFVLGKLVGAVVVAWIMRRREDRGEVDPASA
jgi:queuosine precursor transporter